MQRFLDDARHVAKQDRNVRRGQGPLAQFGHDGLLVRALLQLSHPARLIDPLARFAVFFDHSRIPSTLIRRTEPVPFSISRSPSPAGLRPDVNVRSGRTTQENGAPTGLYITRSCGYNG